VSRRPIWLTDEEAREVAFHLSKDFGIVKGLTDETTEALKRVFEQSLKIACEMPDVDTTNTRRQLRN
jgi:hypothetical protein